MEGFDYTNKSALNGPFYCPECDEECHYGVKILSDMILYHVNHDCSASAKTHKPEEE